MMRHSNSFAVSKRHTKRQLSGLLPSFSPLTTPTGPSALTTSSNNPTDSTSTSANSGTNNSSSALTTGNGPVAGNGLPAGNGATAGNGQAASDSLTAATVPPAAAAGIGSTTVPDSTSATGSTASTDSTKGSGSKAATGATTGTTGSGATTGTNKSGSLNLEPSPSISNNSPIPLSNQSATPASQPPKASSTAVVNTPMVASPVVNPSGPPASPSLTTGNNPAGVAVGQNLYPSAKPASISSNVVTPGSASRSSATPTASDDNTGTSVGTIMGILVAGLIGAVILVGVVGMFFKRKKRRMNNDFDDNPFLNDKYGPDADVGGSPSVDSHGLARSASGTNRTGGVTGPRPPSILERHWGAPALPPPAPTFQPGQNYSASQFAPPSQLNPGHNLHLSQQNGGYAAEHPGYSDGGYEAENSAYGGHHPGPPSSHTAYRGEVQPSNSPNIQRELSLTSQGSPPSFDSHVGEHASKDDSKEAYTAQVAQMDFFGGGRLKNPYDCDEAIRSGTPVQPNIQQSYFAHSYLESFASSPNATRQTQPREFRDQRTLSVTNGHPSTLVGMPLTI